MSDVQSQLCAENIILKPLGESDFTTRYRGSKKKLVNWIWNQIKDFEFETVLDAFGGTGSIAYKAKKEGKTVIYNDYLRYNYHIGHGLIENNSEILTEEDIDFIFCRQNFDYPTFIQDNFKETYYTNEENKWLDKVITNISKIENKYKKSLALYCLFQSCIIKRPYNLFHRKNLYVRTSDVKRSFGNKVTWDKSFEEHFRKFVKEINSCVFPLDGVDDVSNEYSPDFIIEFNIFRFPFILSDLDEINSCKISLPSYVRRLNTSKFPIL